MNKLIKPLFETAVSLFAAIIISVVSENLFSISSFDTILVGLLTFIVVTVVQIEYSTGKLIDQKDHEQTIWAIQNSNDIRLSNIRDAYRKLQENGIDATDLFRSYFDEKISDLEKTILDASERGELQIDMGYSKRTRDILEIFRGTKSDILREVNFIEDNEYLLSVYSRQNFYDIYKHVQSKKINLVKQLLVFSSSEQLESINSHKLLNFYSVTRGYLYKVINMKDYKSLLIDSRLDIPKGMTIYGNLYVYYSTPNRLDSNLGVWTKNPNTLNSYVSFFESCWNSPFALQIRKPDFKENLSPDELFEETQT